MWCSIWQTTAGVLVGWKPQAMLPEGLLNPTGVTVPVKALGSTAVAPANGSAGPAPPPLVGVVGVDAGGVDVVTGADVVTDADDVDDVGVIGAAEVVTVGGTGGIGDWVSEFEVVVSTDDSVEVSEEADVVGDGEPDTGGVVPATALPPTVDEHPASRTRAPITPIEVRSRDEVDTVDMDAFSLNRGQSAG